MPVVKLGGRLGNLLFQVGFGLHQACLSGTPLQVDTDGVSMPTLTGLEAWTGSLSQAPKDLILSLRGPSDLGGKIKRVAQRLTPHSRRAWILQETALFDARYLSPRKNAYFDGYWQSHKYLGESAARLNDRFFFRAPISDALAKWVEKIGSGDSVSLHVRRGDHIGSRDFGGTPTGYFTQALGWLSERNVVGRVFVFSDDPVWCRSNLELGCPFEIVEGQPPEADLFLMTCCRHHIIGASTFSWWGAFLARDLSGWTLAPRNWFSSFGALPPLDDIYPTGWVVLP